jgi:hypothetical protein
MITLKEVRAQLSEFDVRLTKKHTWDGEYSIGFGKVVYHADTLEEALKTGFAMQADAKRQEFKRLEALASAHTEATGDFDAESTLANALTNADDTFKHDENAPRYWDVALGSIQDSIQANCLEKKLFPWFKQHGFKI